MGNNNNKASFLSYEEAAKRVSDPEMKRLREAFKRSCISSFLPKNMFIREILGEGVPPKLSEQIYLAFGGNTKGVTFKELLPGLVVLTRGRQEEKLKFIFGLYANESLHLQKEVVDSLILSTEGHIPESLSELFYKNDKVEYDQFKTWIVEHPDCTSISKWLLQEPCLVTLTDDNETPTFYQTLAGVTHLTEADILELEKRYWALKGQSTTGYFDFNTLKPMICPTVPDSLAEGVFCAFDENRDNHIDFKEMACGISACCRGPVAERQKFCFKIFDKDQDGLLSREEQEDMIEAMLTVRQESKPKDELKTDIFANVNAGAIVAEILDQHDSDKDGFITLEEYVIWAVEHKLPEDFLSLLFDVCHIVLGLKPATKEEEGKVVRGWLAREERRGLKMGQTWYLLDMRWWRSWCDYVNSKTYLVHPGHAQPSSMLASRAVGGLVNTNMACCTQPDVSGLEMVDVDEYGVIVTENYTSDDANTQTPQLRSSSLPRNGAPNGSIRKLSHGTYSTPTSPSRSPRLPKSRNGGMGLAQKPSAIDNTSLIMINVHKVSTLTNEGGRLKKDTVLVKGRDFETVPEAVWRALSAWYGGSPALPRSVIMTHNDTPEVELYPRLVRIFRHQQPNQRTVASTSTFTGMMSGMGGLALNSIGIHSTPTTPRRYLAYISCFSCRHTLRQIIDFLCMRLRINREDLRLWKFKDEQNMTLLEDEDMTMEELDIEDNSQLLIEVRNKDLTWPEEISQLAKNKDQHAKKSVMTQRGATGLNNLGNTCFMNSAMQCVSNTKPLTAYFTGGMHLYELNRDNPLGMKGHIAQRYGDLVKDLWSGTAKTVAPLRLRWTIGKYAPRFNGFQQHDSQEFLGFLLDGLHEDLNRVHDKPYVELKDSDGRPDEEVANEAWENHLLRNKSIVVDLFHGQLKSQVRCMECGHISARFDPFTYLSLPLPMESCIHLELIVIKLDGSVPVKYGIRLNMDEKYKSLKKQLSELSNIPPDQLLLAELLGATIKSIPNDNQKMKTTMSIGNLYAYELAPTPQIKPMTVREEKESRSVKGLALIQRSSNVQLTNGLNNGECQATSLPPVDTPDIRIKDSSGTEISQQPQQNGIGHHGRQPSDVSVESSSINNGSLAAIPLDNFNGFIVSMHRKMIRMDMYFLSSQKTRPSLFGTPLVLPCFEETTQQDLYLSVWSQVSRLVSPLPPTEANSPNHAQDCDDSLGYEYPFTLKLVQKDGYTCAHCPWYRFCRGCKIDCNLDLFNFNSSYIAIDWEPTALHLRYQTSQERAFEDHSSVTESRRLQSEPIDLADCLKAFTNEEELGEDELYYCSKCKEHRLAAKKLDIWRLPPVLIIHLKRFQFLNGRWVKSRKIVNFPRGEFDPAEYLAPRTPKSKRIEDIVRMSNHDLHAETFGSPTTEVANGDTDPEHTDSLSNGLPRSNSGIKNKTVTFVEDKSKAFNRSDSRPEDILLEDGKDKETETTLPRKPVHSVASRRSRTVSVDSCDYTYTTYDLYALSCHTGILGGGHYVSYGKNPNEKWYCYNDSSCKEAKEEDIDVDSAYILFYERNDWDYSKIIPDVSGKEPDMSEIEDDYESEFKKHCIIQ